MARVKKSAPAQGRTKPAPPAKGEAKPERKAKAVQMSLEAAAPPAAPPPPPSATTAAGDVVVELLHNRQGCWKRMASGEGIAISEKEWQLELSRLLSRRAAAALDPGDPPKS